MIGIYNVMFTRSESSTSVVTKMNVDEQVEDTPNNTSNDMLIKVGQPSTLYQ